MQLQPDMVTNQSRVKLWQEISSSFQLLEMYISCHDSHYSSHSHYSCNSSHFTCTTVTKHEVRIKIKNTTQQVHIIINFHNVTMLSDHNFIDCSLYIENPKPQAKTVTYRKLKNIDIKILGEDIGEALEAANNCSDLAALVYMCNVKLSEVLDNHTLQRPKQSRFCIINPC